MFVAAIVRVSRNGPLVLYLSSFWSFNAVASQKTPIPSGIGLKKLCNTSWSTYENVAKSDLFEITIEKHRNQLYLEILLRKEALPNLLPIFSWSQNYVKSLGEKAWNLFIYKHQVKYYNYRILFVFIKIYHTVSYLY